MASAEGWDDLPRHFAREAAVLRDAGVSGWERLAGQSPERLRALARPGGASEARLLRLRAQARLMTATGLSAAEASLLLHAGIGEARALATADPQRLLVQVNRLGRQLLGPGARPVSLATVRGWILAASSRSAN
ncbi:MAG: DUF4332 domain-containing protein [Cyanobacteriota bacterium]|nr:DUF4332 domain-containing protein [Cyanobacteriota bacterium]